VHDDHQRNLDPLPGGRQAGNIQSIRIVWVNLNTISSTTRSSPTVREIGVISVSGGI
jgi:hypothetical protein